MPRCPPEMSTHTPIMLNTGHMVLLAAHSPPSQTQTLSLPFSLGYVMYSGCKTIDLVPFYVGTAMVPSIK